MSRPVLAAVLLLLSIVPLRVSAAAGPGLASALPARAHIGAVLAIPLAPTDFAVAYRSGSWYLGVASTSGGAHLLWHRSLDGAPDRLEAPESHGMFRAVAPASSGGARYVYAYRVSGGNVVSAISGRRDGAVLAAEGDSLTARGFTLRNPDLTHRGSVAYRLVTSYVWQGQSYHRVKTVSVPDYPTSKYPTPRALFNTSAGSQYLLRLEVADTEAERDLGLMYRTSLDPDGAMLFVWPSPVQESFWMENTSIPLSVAFLSPDGRIQEMQDMQPFTTDMHTPAQPYQFAIEANLGYFAAHGIALGDTAVLTFSTPGPALSPTPPPQGPTTSGMDDGVAAPALSAS